uniref:tRNA methyltransferase 10 homolog B isoform X4 n=1 Tax=Solea senegalensis TaxID=28829 RepID=UPI001CD8290E|nr:tRNA methyltransferase 10 homolog B isoform X4 [Solea senegalensis]
MNATGSRFCLWYSRVISSYFILLYTFICRFQFVIENTECPGNVCETSRHERSRQMAHIPSAECDMQLNGVSEEMDLLHIQVEADVVEEKPGREDALCSRNVLRKQRNWERQLAVKKGKRKEEKQRKRLNRERESGASVDVPQFTKRVMKAMTKERLAEAQSTGLKLCVDLSMTDSMSDKEISRLAGQLRRVYGSNKKAARPFHLFLTDLREDSRLYRECIRKNDGFLSYMSKKLEQASVRGSQGVNRMIVRWKSQMKVFWTFSRQKLLSTSPQTPNKHWKQWMQKKFMSLVVLWTKASRRS